MAECEYCGSILEAEVLRCVEVEDSAALLSELHMACPECAASFDTVFGGA